MKCEICGKEIIGEPHRVLVDGAILLVCRSCARFGKPVREEKAEKPEVIRTKAIRQGSTSSRIRLHSRRVSHEKELISNYNKLIVEKRESLGWSTEQLARVLKEKETWIKKIEAGKIKPPLYLIKKIERVLGLSLLTDVPDIPPDEISPPKKDLTIGDLIEFKEKKKHKKYE